MNNTFLKKALLILFTIGLVSFAQMHATSSYSFFEAGQRDYWPPTNEGYTAQFTGTPVTFAPAIYNLGQAIAPQITITNPTNEAKTQTIYLYVSKVIESPIGQNIESGYPEMTDGELNTNEQADNDVQAMPIVYTIGTYDFPAGGSKDVSFSFTPDSVGYYQFDFSTLPPNNGYIHGHILAAGFVRVLTGTPSSPSPTPTATPNPSSEPTPTPTVQPSPTPTATPGQQNIYNDLNITYSCPSNTWNTRLTLKRDNVAVTNNQVSYEYKDIRHIQRTNNEGISDYSFADQGKGVFKLYIDSYTGHEVTLEKPNCSTTSTEPQNAVAGRVLGASTEPEYAATGTATENLTNQIMFGLSVASAFITAKLFSRKAQ